MASQPTTNASPVRGSSSSSSSTSTSLTSTPTAPTAQQPPSRTPATTTQQSASTSTPASLFTASVPVITSQPLPATATPATATPSTVPLMRIIIPAISAVAGIFVFLLVYYLYRRYQRRQQLKEAPLPAKRTPVILERRRAQSMYRCEMPRTPSNAEYDSLIAPITSPPNAASYIPFPSKADNIFDGVYTQPSLPASASVLSLEKHPSTPPDELVKDTFRYTPHGSPQFLQLPSYARRDSRPVARHSRPVSMVSVASRHSTHSIATMRSGQHPGSGLRGAPHKNNMNIVLPRPLGPNSRTHSTYNTLVGEPLSVHLQHKSSTRVIPPLPWNEHGELRYRSDTPRHGVREEWEEGNSGSYQGSSSSLANLLHSGMSHSPSAPATINWRHNGSLLPGTADYSVNIDTSAPPAPPLPQQFHVDMSAPPVPPLPQQFHMPRTNSRASRASNQNSSALLAPPASVPQLQQPSPPRSPRSKRASVDEDIPGLDIEIHTDVEPEKLEQIPRLEDPAQQIHLLPNSVFNDPDGGPETATIESRQAPASTHAQPPPLGNRRTDAVNTARHAATPAAS